MGSFSLKKEIIIKDIRNLFRLKKNQITLQLKIQEIFLDKKKETKAFKDRILRNIKNLFEHEEEENYYKPVRVSHFWSKNYNEYESIDNRNKTLSVEEYLDKISPYLRHHK